MAVCAAGWFLAFLVGSAHVQVSYTTHHVENTLTDENLHEAILILSNANGNTFGTLFKVTVDDQVYTTPL
jgi:hypothetical protein